MWYCLHRNVNNASEISCSSKWNNNNISNNNVNQNNDTNKQAKTKSLISLKTHNQIIQIIAKFVFINRCFYSNNILFSAIRIDKKWRNKTKTWKWLTSNNTNKNIDTEICQIKFRIFDWFQYLSINSKISIN